MFSDRRLHSANLQAKWSRGRVWRLSRSGPVAWRADRRARVAQREQTGDHSSAHSALGPGAHLHRKDTELARWWATARIVPAQAAVPERQGPGAWVCEQGRSRVFGKSGQWHQRAQLHKLHIEGTRAAHAIRGRHERCHQKQWDRPVAVQRVVQWFPLGYENLAQAAHSFCRIHGNKRTAFGPGRQHGRWQSEGKALVQHNEHSGRFVQPGRSGADSLFDDFDKHCSKRYTWPRHFLWRERLVRGARHAENYSALSQKPSQTRRHWMFQANITTNGTVWSKWIFCKIFTLKSHSL